MSIGYFRACAFSFWILLLTAGTGRALNYSVIPVPNIDEPIDLNVFGDVVGESTGDRLYYHWNRDNGLQTIASTDGYDRRRAFDGPCGGRLAIQTCSRTGRARGGRE